MSALPPELAATVGNREWRLDNLYQVIDEDGMITPFRARGEQLDFRRNATHLNFIPKARKLGMSTEVVLENLDACLFNPNFRAAIVDKSEEDAWDKLQIARFAWEHGVKHQDSRIALIWSKIHKLNTLQTNSNSEMAWQNGSRFEASVSFTGGTIQSLHVSELGPIAAQKPGKANEIRRGSMNAVPPTGRITVETTMEGGRVGVCYELFRQAKEATKKRPDEWTILDWRLHFFSWLGHPSYTIPGAKPTKGDTHKYFAELSLKYGDWMQETYGFRTVPLERQAWWEGKKATLRDEMCQQFPSVIDECDMATVVGAIYPEMNSVRSQGRINDFVRPERGLPLFTAFDLGVADATAGWLLQESGRNINVIDWTTGDGSGAAGVASVLRRWEREYGQIERHFLPHDADRRENGSGLSYRQQLEACKIPANTIVIVPRTPIVWRGIDAVRMLIPRMWFHSRCDVEIKNERGEIEPSAVGRLEGYRKKLNVTGDPQGIPHKDGICDHMSDAMRTYAEAKELGLVDAVAGYSGPVSVVLAGDYARRQQPSLTVRRAY